MPSPYGVVMPSASHALRSGIDAWLEHNIAYVGSPETVRQQITEFVKEFRIGNLLMMLQVVFMGAISSEMKPCSWAAA